MLAGLLLITGCSQISYYGQSVIGHSKLMLARQPIDKAIQSAEGSEDRALAEQLRLAKRIRTFASDRLALPDNDSYSSYVPLKRRYPVWTIVAAEEFSVDARKWCYLVIGCASYRGYFSLESANQFAQELQEEGWETSVSGAVAYSTLGWFADPLLPSMLTEGEASLAEIMFHELAHQVLYLKDNSEFNEAFATVVGEQGAQLWLQANNPPLLPDYQQSRLAYTEFTSLLLATRAGLAKVYNGPQPEAEKRQRKEQILVQLQERYEQIKAKRWQGRGWFDGWFDVGVNNARLASVATYQQQVPKLNSLLERCAHDFERFFRTLKSASKTKPFLLPDACS